MTQELTKSQRRLVYLVRQVGMLTIDEISQRLGWSREAASSHLRRTRRAGAIDYTLIGARCLWHLPEQASAAQELLDRHAAETREARLKRDRDRHNAAYAAKRAAMMQEDEQWSELLPVQRCISAVDAPPIRPSAPTSVFALAQTSA